MVIVKGKDLGIPRVIICIFVESFHSASEIGLGFGCNIRAGSPSFQIRRVVQKVESDLSSFVDAFVLKGIQWADIAASSAAGSLERN